MNIFELKNRLMAKMRSVSLRLINELVPKKTGRIVFSSLPDFSDNAKGLWEYIKELEGYEPIWLVRDKSLVEELASAGINCLHQDSREGVRALLTAQYIVCTHSQFIDIKCGRQSLINLWHGMPLKNMGFLDPMCNEKDLNSFRRASRKSDMLIATSMLMKHVLVSCFHIDPRKVFVTGQPRNDKLFAPPDSKVLSAVLGDLMGKYKRYIFYCPTFRVGMGRVEGKRIPDNVFSFGDYDKKALDAILKKHDALLVIKLHPFEERQYETKDLNLPDNAVLIRSDLLNRNHITIYDILNLFDVLITDYSSIYFDYLLLDRPMLFITSDLAEYRSGRGLVFEDYDFWAPGPKACSFAELATNLEECLNNELFYSRERKTVNDLVNSCKDGQSAARVVDCMKKMCRMR